MKKWLKKILGVGLISTLLLTSGLPAFANDDWITDEETFESEIMENGKRIIAYFPNWGTYGAAHQNFSVGDIPWDKVTHINHSFYTIDKNLKIASIDTFADYQKGYAHSDGWGVPNRLAGHFGEYRYYKSKYPNVKVLVSVGGWTRGERFHEMALTAENRAVFINSLIEFLKEYPFIDGIDLDWEYPGIDRPKDPNDQYDRGCPGGPEDKENFTLLLKEIREAYNNNGLSDRLLTIAAPGGYDKMRLQEPDVYHQYLDFINVMTYDFHGAWEQVTNHHAGLFMNPNDPSGTEPTNIKEMYNTDAAMSEYVNTYKIPAEKLAVGTPFYSRGWGGVQANSVQEALFAPASKYYRGGWDDTAIPTPGGQEGFYKLKQFENSPEWQKARDPYSKTPYMYNKSLQVFLTYEDEESLQARCDYVNERNFGGMIIWEISGDVKSANYPMTTIIYNALRKGYVDQMPKTPTLNLVKAPEKGNYDLQAVLMANHQTESLMLYENGQLLETKAIDSSTETLVFNFIAKAEGSYEYTLKASNAHGEKTSNLVKVVVPKEDGGQDPGHQNLKLDFKVTSSWGSGFNFDATLTNLTGKTLKKVTVVFDYPFEISSVWSDFKLVSKVGNTYTLETVNYINSILPDQVLKFGGGGSGSGLEAEPTNIQFIVEE